MLLDHAGASRSAVDAFVVGLGVEPTPATRRLWLDAEAVHFERWRSGEIAFGEQRRERLRSVLPGLGLPVPSSPDGLDALSLLVDRDGGHRDGIAGAVRAAVTR